MKALLSPHEWGAEGTVQLLRCFTLVLRSLGWHSVCADLPALVPHPSGERTTDLSLMLLATQLQSTWMMMRRRMVELGVVPGSRAILALVEGPRVVTRDIGGPT